MALDPSVEVEPTKLANAFDAKHEEGREVKGDFFLDFGVNRCISGGAIY